jgi:ABC-type uncharacterized transport system fused permease/ATPase subunit
MRYLGPTSVRIMSTLGTLASALLYPRGGKCGVSAARLATVLEEVGLGTLTGELDMVENWSQRLSLD